MSADASDLIRIIEFAREHPGMFTLRTHREAIAWLAGMNVGTGLLPGREMTDWLLSDGDPRWGGRGGIGWEQRVAMNEIDGFWDRYHSLTSDDEAAATDAILAKAVEYLTDQA